MEEEREGEDGEEHFFVGDLRCCWTRKARGGKSFTQVVVSVTLGVYLVYTQGRMLRKQPNFSRSVFLTFTIYFVSEQGNRFGAKVISLGYLGYLNFQTPIFSSFSNF